MAMLVHDPYVEDRLKAEREASGADRFDEVWDGVYMMNPLPNEEHHDIATGIAAVLKFVLGLQSGHKVYAGVNVSDRIQGWEHNYRGPDVAIYLRDTAAKNCSTHWCGGPDLAIEIVSPGDHSREKVAFYELVKSRELLIVDRKPWKLELYRLVNDKLEFLYASTIAQDTRLRSEVVPVSFRLAQDLSRPSIDIAQHNPSGTVVQSWKV